jgi:hypothetical protein
MTGMRRPEILVVCPSELILNGVTGLLVAAGYAVQGFVEPWRAHKVATSHPFDLAIVGSTDVMTQELVAYLRRCAPPVKVLELDGISRRGKIGQRSSDGLGPSLLTAVAQLIGTPGPTSGSPGPTAA